MRTATAASVHLDMLRGLSALAVLVYHVRYRFFLDYSDLESPGIITKAFYGLTSFGHDAVMAFFVLSGLFIAGSIAGAAKRQTWSWHDYILSRLTRLYVVLLPALALTLLWDAVGLSIRSDHPVYTGITQEWKHDYFDVANRTSVVNLVGNLAFLQTIFVPPLGSNEPLWSLAYEFWYYGMFPCIYLLVFYYKSWLARGICLVALLLMAKLVGIPILLYFPIWLLGALIGFLPPCRWIQGRIKITLTILAAMFASVMALAGHVGFVKHALGGETLTMDYLTAIGVAVFVYVLLQFKETASPGPYATLAKWIASFSFTLYVTHMPLLILLRSVLIGGRPWDGSIESIAAAAGISIIAILFAVMVYHVTERHTAGVKNWMMTNVTRRFVTATQSSSI